MDFVLRRNHSRLRFQKLASIARRPVFFAPESFQARSACECTVCNVRDMSQRYFGSDNFSNKQHTNDEWSPPLLPCCDLRLRSCSGYACRRFSLRVAQGNYWKIDEFGFQAHSALRLATREINCKFPNADGIASDIPRDPQLTKISFLPFFPHVFPTPDTGHLSYSNLLSCF